MLTDEQLANLVFVSALPLARLAVDQGVAAKEVKQLTELATYGELKRRSMSMKAIAKKLSVSVPKVSLLAKDLRQHFSRPEHEYGLEKRIVSLLRAGPESVRRLTRTVGDEFDEAEVEAVLAKLEAEGVVESVAGRTVRYRICSRDYRRVLEPWLARVDALRDLMLSISEVIRARFFEDDPQAMARTVTFRARREDLDRLRTYYEETLFPLILEIDEAAGSAGDEAVDVRMSFVFAPEAAPSTDKDET